MDLRVLSACDTVKPFLVSSDSGTYFQRSEAQRSCRDAFHHQCRGLFDKRCCFDADSLGCQVCQGPQLPQARRKGAAQAAWPFSRQHFRCCSSDAGMSMRDQACIDIALWATILSACISVHLCMFQVQKDPIPHVVIDVRDKQAAEQHPLPSQFSKAVAIPGMIVRVSVASKYYCIQNRYSFDAQSIKFSTHFKQRSHGQYMDKMVHHTLGWNTC